MARVTAHELPSGTLTFLLTDIEGSTRLWEQHPRAMRSALARHDALFERHVTRLRGLLVRPRGEGDSRFAVFTRASDAVAAACAVQRALVRQRWDLPEPLRVRMALHTGEAELVDGDYYGTTINRCARLRSVAYGGQIILSEITARIVHDHLPQGSRVQMLGTYHLKDLTQDEVIFQLVHPELPIDFPPLASSEERESNMDRLVHLATVNEELTVSPLPVPVTSFIGRQHDVAQVSRMLRSCRLLTLTGAGGIGKTRLALEVATRIQQDYADGTALVELAPLADPILVVQAVASALGVHERPGLPLITRLLDVLRRRSMLLVLDNCEHLVQSCAELADRLLPACPSLRILATSREALGVLGESVWRVPSLSVPEESASVAAEVLVQSEAARLFIERAQAALPSFVVTTLVAESIGYICRRLDGIALALELAAAWVPVLSVEQISERLDDALGLLVTGSRAAPVRQQTLRATLDWSYDLLTEPERRLFNRLAVFAGGWTLTSAEMVCSGGVIQRASVLDSLAQLVKKSLVLTESLPDASVRYRLLEPVRQYARERLTSVGDAEAVQQRHALHFLELAERAEEGLRSPDQRRWRDWLEREYDNMRAALAWAQAVGDAELGQRLAGALSRFWAMTGLLREGLGWLDTVQALGSGSPPLRAKVLSGSGWLAMLQGDLIRARRDLEASLALVRMLRDTSRIAETLRNLGRVGLDEGDLAAAQACFIESLELSRALGHRWSVAFNVTGLAEVAFLERNFQKAHSFFEQALALYRLLDSPQHIAVTLSNLATVILQQGDEAEAQRHFAQALDLAATQADSSVLAHVLEGLAGLVRARGNPERAQMFLGAAARMRRGDHSPAWISDHAWPEVAPPVFHTGLGADASTAAWHEGGSWSYQRALAEAAEAAGKAITAPTS